MCDLNSNYDNYDSNNEIVNVIKDNRIINNALTFVILNVFVPLEERILLKLMGISMLFK